MEATISIVLSNHTSRITQLEYSSSVAEDTIDAHTSKLAEIETKRQSDVAEIQAHDARILGLEQAVSDIHSDTLKKLGKTSQKEYC